MSPNLNTSYPQRQNVLNEPLVSIVLPVFNRQNYLGKTIESLINQSYHNYEIIIIDDGSNDLSVSIAEEYQKRYPQKIQIYLQPNKGVSSARNLGIKKAMGKYIAFIDSDDLWISNKLEIQIRNMEKNKWDVCQTDEIWIRNGIRVNEMKKHKKKGGKIFYDCLPLCMVSPSAVVIKKTVFQKSGYFDEKLRVVEDYDLWLRISLFYPVYFIPQKLIIKYGGHSDQLSRKYETMDRFRIYAMLKLIRNNKMEIDAFKKAALWWWINKKSNIICKGAQKRKNWFRYIKYKFIEIQSLINWTHVK